MAHWEDTLIKSSDIKWKRLRVTSTDDGKMDLDLHLPLTNLFRGQAKRSFEAGIAAAFQFHMKIYEESRPIEIEDLASFFNECGLPELAKQVIERAEERP